MQPSALAKRLFILLFILVAGFYFYGIGRLPLVGPDEPRYAQIAREMFVRGDFVTPTLAGYTWFEKPPLLYWMMMVAYKFFGVGEFAARVGPALSGILTSLAVWVVTRKVERAHPDRLSGFSFWSTTVVITSLGMIVFSRGATFDIVVTMTITVALVFFLLYELPETPRSRYVMLACFYGAMGLSLLAKGLVGIVIPLGVVGVYHLFARKRPSRKLLISLLWGLPVTILIASTWYMPVIYKHGWPFVDEFFVQHHFARYVSNKYKHPQPLYFYIPILLMLALPWTAFLIDSLFHVRPLKGRSTDVRVLVRIFALSWLVFPIFFFSLAGSKLPGYILPVLPAVAILIGECINRSASRWPIVSTGAITIVLAAAAIFYSITSGLPPIGKTIALTAPLLLSGALAIYLVRNPSLAILSVSFGIIVTLTGVVRFAAIDFAEKQSVRTLLEIGDSRGFGSAPIFIRGDTDRTAEFYGRGRVVYGPDGEPIRLDDVSDMAAETKRRGERILVMVSAEYLEYYRNFADLEIIADNGELALLATRVRRSNQ